MAGDDPAYRWHGDRADIGPDIGQFPSQTSAGRDGRRHQSICDGNRHDDHVSFPVRALAAVAALRRIPDRIRYRPGRQIETDQGQLQGGDLYRTVDRVHHTYLHGKYYSFIWMYRVIHQG